MRRFIGLSVSFIVLVSLLGAVPGVALTQVGMAQSILPERSTAVDPDSSVMFIENVGQWPEAARFQVWGGPGTMWLAEDAIWIALQEPEPEQQPGDDPAARLDSKQAREVAPRRGANVKLAFPGANPHPRLEPVKRLDTHVSYFIGKEPDKWRPDVPVWGGVRYVDLYPGVDLEVEEVGGQVVPRFQVRPGADLHAVLMQVLGAEVAVLNGRLLHLNSAVGALTLAIPEADFPFIIEGSTQSNQGASWVVTLSVRLASEPADSDGNTDDLVYGTFLGGRDYDEAYGIAVDSAGNTYVTGETYTPDFPTTPGAFDAILNSSRDAFVVKLNPTGSTLAYASFLGGDGNDEGNGIAVDGMGNAYVTGNTQSANFPTTAGAFGTGYHGQDDAFVVKLNSTGSTLSYAALIGGGDLDWGADIATDGRGSAFVIGTTRSSSFPVTAAAFDRSLDGQDAFILKLNPAGNALTYATFLGGQSSERGFGIVVDGSGNAYVTGETFSQDFPTTPNAFKRIPVGNDVFAAKLNPTGSGLLYSTCLGGWDSEEGQDIAVDAAGYAYVTGSTRSTDFPTTPGAFDTSLNGGILDAFAVKLSPSASELVYATFLGGSEEDYGYSVIVDGWGNAYVTGETYSDNFPTTPGAFDAHPDGATDAFVVELNQAGSRLSYATLLGGSGGDWGSDIVMDAAGSIYLAGSTTSRDFPTTPGAFDTSLSSWLDAFVAKLRISDGALPSLRRIYLPLIMGSSRDAR